jgi:hexokinase
VSRRSAAVVAASVFALWELKREAEAEYAPQTPGEAAEFAKREAALDHVVVGYNGSVIEHYPGYRQHCQAYIDSLAGPGVSIELVPAKESSLLGAAVALACFEEGGA